MTRIVLQERDIDILHSVGMARLLTAQEVEWLHYPAWRSHYRVYLERNQKDSPYRVRPRVYRRLAQLRACGLLVEAVRRPYQIIPLHGRIAGAVCLTRAGADVLVAKRNVELKDIALVPHPERPAQHTEHTLAIGRCYAALRSATTERGISLEGWIGDALLRSGVSGYDQIVLPGIRETVSLIPDAAFVLGGERYFLEVDRGTHRIAQWRTKLRAYERYQGSELLRARYGTNTFCVLIVALDAQRLERIATAIGQECGLSLHNYRLIEMRLVHPTTIRRGWRQVVEVSTDSRLVRDRLSTGVVSTTLAQAPLWEGDVR